jgi:FecR protein
MSRSIVIATVFAALVGAGCKKKDSEGAKQESKTQEGTPAKKDPAPAEGGATASTGAGVQAGGIKHDDSEGAAGIVSAANGTVEVRRVGETQYTAARSDTKLYAGDTVRTGESSTATITLADESTIEVAEVTTIALASRDGTADPASAAAVLGGIARFTVTPRAPAEGPFRVYASSGVILTRGTVYGVGVAASGDARVGVESGQVDVIGLAQLDAQPVAVPKASNVVISADGKVGTAAAWPADDWGTWRDNADANIQLDAALDAHGAAMTSLDKLLVDGYAELQSNADAAATFEATAATSAEKNDPAMYTAALPDGAATIDASFLLGARLEALTWAYASHAALATDIYVRHPAEAEAKWTVIAPQIDASVLWPKRFEVTASAYFEPLRAQYYVHHPRGRAHAQLVGIAVPQFYAQVEPPAIDPVTVRGKLKGQVWLAPQLSYHASPRPIWVTAPAPTWNANVKATIAPPRAKVAWYVRPPALKAKLLVGTNVSGAWKSKLDVKAPQPRAQLAAMWTVPVGMKVKIAPPDLSMAATARAKVKLGADGQLIQDHRVDINAGMPPAPDVKAGVKAKVDAKIGVKAPVVKVPDVKAKVGAGVKIGTDAKAKVGGAVKAGASVKVKVNVPKPPPPPSIKVEGKVKASGGFKIGH